MRNFVIVMLCVFALDTIGRAGCLWMRAFERKPGAMALDIVLNLLLCMWAAYLLGAGNA